MIYDRWWTPKIETTTSPLGKLSFDGYLGTYRYNIRAGDTERTGTFNIENSKASGMPNSVILSLDSSIPDQVVITTDIPSILCEGESITLKAPMGTGLNYRWFRNGKLIAINHSSIETGQQGIYRVAVIKGSVEITSPPLEVKVNPVPEAMISVSGDLSFDKGASVILNANDSDSLNYDWLKGDKRIIGEVTSIEVFEPGEYTLRTFINGCSATSDPVTVSVCVGATGQLSDADEIRN